MAILEIIEDAHFRSCCLPLCLPMPLDLQHSRLPRNCFSGTVDQKRNHRNVASISFRKVPIDKVIEFNASLDDWRMDEKVVVGSELPTPISAGIKQFYDEKSEFILSKQSQFSLQNDEERKSRLNELMARQKSFRQHNVSSTRGRKEPGAI